MCKSYATKSIGLRYELAVLLMESGDFWAHSSCIATGVLSVGGVTVGSAIVTGAKE